LDLSISQLIIFPLPLFSYEHYKRFERDQPD